MVLYYHHFSGCLTTIHRVRDLLQLLIGESDEAQTRAFCDYIHVDALYYLCISSILRATLLLLGQISVYYIAISLDYIVAFKGGPSSSPSASRTSHCLCESACVCVL